MSATVRALIEERFSTLGRLRIPCEELRCGALELSAEASHYALRVHRVQVGDELELFDAKTGQLASAVVDVLPRAKGARLTVVIDEVRQCQEQPTRLSLLCCLGKGDKPEQALRDATALGACRVVLVLSDRVQSPSGERDRERYERVMIETARQSGRGRVPRVEGPLCFSAAIAEARGLRLACVPGPRSLPLLTALGPAETHEDITVLIGPEGGLSAAELEGLEVAGFRFCSLGPFVLRAERAVPVALGIVQAFREARGL